MYRETVFAEILRRNERRNSALPKGDRNTVAAKIRDRGADSELVSVFRLLISTSPWAAVPFSLPFTRILPRTILNSVGRQCRMAPTKTAVPTAVRKTCELCRMRKIKCDHELPCGQCIRRGRPDLCHYNRRAGKRAAKSAASARGAPLSESTNSLSAAERTDWPVPTTLNLSCHQNATTLGMRDDAFDTQQASDQTTRNPYFGANSLSDFLDDGSSAKTSSQYAASQGVRDAMMPMLGVATQVSGYPFYTPSEDAERQAIARLCRLLPSNKDIIK